MKRKQRLALLKRSPVSVPVKYWNNTETIIRIWRRWLAALMNVDPNCEENISQDSDDSDDEECNK